MRASVAAEKAGVPTASIIASGFLTQAKMVAQSQGLSDCPVIEYPGVIMTDSPEALKKKVEAFIPEITKALTEKKSVTRKKQAEPGLEDIVFKGSLREVNEFFTVRQWSDGLPIVPPVISEVQQFLNFTSRSPSEIIAVLPPENREATIWNIAVNGVMAGCRPEYMPILISLVEAIAVPEFRLEDAGSTPGWEPLIIINGDIIKDLNFNYKGSVLRVGRLANTSIGRFLRLYLINVAGLRIAPSETDKGCFGSSFNVVLAENEEACAEIGWPTFSAERGFKPGENVVTVQSVVAPTLPIYTGGASVEEHLKIIAEVFGRTNAYWAYICSSKGKANPLLVMSPSIARVFADNGWSKDKIKQYLYDNVLVKAELVERMGWHGGLSTFNFCNLVQQGVLPQHYCESNSPDRLVRVFFNPRYIGIVVSGDPGRNQSKGYIQNHIQGSPVSKRISLPDNWKQIKE